MLTTSIINAATVPAGAQRVAAPPTADPPSVPRDTVMLSTPSASRGLWVEAASLGLLSGAAAAAGVGAPLGQVLSQQSQAELGQMLEQLQAAGARFSMNKKKASPAEVLPRLLQCTASDLPLSVSASKTAASAVPTLNHLQVLDALYCGGSADALRYPHTAAALRFAESEGERVYPAYPPESKARPFDRYGAYQALSDKYEGGKRDLWLGPDTWHLEDEQHLLEAVCFNLNGPSDGLHNQALADSLLSLSEQGFTFYRCQGKDELGAEMDPRVAWEELAEHPTRKLFLGISGEPVEKIDQKTLLEPSGRSQDLEDAARFYQEGLRPRVEAKKLFEENAGVQVSRFLEHVRGPLRREAFDDAEYARNRASFVQLAAAAGDTKVASQAADLVAIEALGAPHEERLAVMTRLLELERDLGKCKHGPSSEDEDRRGDEDTPPTVRALDDYRALISNTVPGQKMGEAADVLVAFHQAIVPKKGWQDSLDSFVYIQKGVRYDAFDGRTVEQARVEFLQSFLMNQSLEAARAVLRTPPQSAKKVEAGDGQISIGGVKVPVRT